MYQNPSPWTGRIDGHTEEHLRWHQTMLMGDLSQPILNSDFGILGFACDEGVRRNNGRVGAQNGPEFLRKACSNFPSISRKSLADYGDVLCDDTLLEKAHDQLAQGVSKLQHNNVKSIVFGGGHEVMYGHYKGLRLAYPDQCIGILNFDAHFDNRAVNQDVGPTSGTGFWQIAREDENYDYLTVGIQPNSNTEALFNEARNSNTKWINADELTPENQIAINERIDTFLQSIDVLYVTLCLDVFAAAYAPGVSATAYSGIFPDQYFKQLFRKVVSSEKLKGFDIAELNPQYDIDNRTAKLAAAFVFEVVVG